MERYRQSNRIHMNIHTGDTDRSSEIVRQRKRHTHSDASRHVEETHADPWIHPGMLRKRLFDHQTAIPTWGRHSQTLPYTWIHMGEIDITRENHSDGYTGKIHTVPLKQSDTPR